MCNKLEVAGLTQTAIGRGLEDREDAPIFPLMPRVLEALRARAAAEGGEAVTSKDRDAYAALIESICGATDDSQPVERYDGTLGVPRAFVDGHQAAVGQIQWNADLATKYSQPGDAAIERRHDASRRVKTKSAPAEVLYE